MPDEKGLYGTEELANYDFQNVVTPEGFDPNASGFRDAPVGVHPMRIDAKGSKVAPNQQFNCDGVTYTLNQFRPALRVVGGPHDGAGAMDFLPMPTPGIVMPKKLADRWANFIRAYGFQPTEKQLTPNDFSIPKLCDGRCAMVDLRQKLDRDKKVQLRDDGRPQIGVAYFGYSPMASGAASHGTPVASAVKPGAVTAPPKKEDLDV